MTGAVTAPGTGHALGLDVGGSHVTAALVSLSGRRVLREVRRTLAHDAPLDQIVGGWAEAALEAVGDSREHARPSHLGVAVPGPFDLPGGTSQMTHKFAALLGVPLPLVWGLFSFVTNYIPNIGFVIGLVPPALIALLDGGVGAMVAVIIVYVVINIVVQTIIQPRFTGDAVGISGTVAFVSLIFWAFLLGGLGALLAVPATLFRKSVLVDNSVPASWVNALISSNPKDDRPMSPKARALPVRSRR